MSKLLKGKLISAEKMLVETIYNLEVQENAGLDTTNGVVVGEEASFPTPKVGKGFLWYVNPITGEQWFEEYDRPLTPEEQLMKELEAQRAVTDQLLLDALGGGSIV
ncbi:hypothetical protein [Paenibacillus spongiae]|uniref:Transposase n=1 Tax=Paenibacillus spongiae TaxID=2909671 RepID=A0ABY5S2N9_9BACL|nr:hypothetical protein [Paenibacillus spongiae]UVI28156.1 hypothetical protein L1F29_22220 [Paenibacillus spongiae]